MEDVMPKVWNKRDANVPKDAVYIGRGSRFGNPFYMHSESERDKVCKQFEEYWLVKMNADKVVEKIEKDYLKDKDLVCWCAPKRCHGDFLLKWANS
jgi:hypothetical protein